MNRRRFLHASAAAAVAGTAGGCAARKNSYRFLTPEEADTLQALCSFIIPEDSEPGARQAGVIHYIDRQLAGRFREHQAIYRRGLAAAAQMAGGSLAKAAPARQEAIVRQLERGRETRAFFALAVAHTMQGFYGSPRHGGNRDFASWRMLRVPVSPVRGRAHDGAAPGGRDEEG